MRVLFAIGPRLKKQQDIKTRCLPIDLYTVIYIAMRIYKNIASLRDVACFIFISNLQSKFNAILCHATGTIRR
jgi:hypothetical protein